MSPFDYLEGSIDDFNRPLVRLEVPGFPDPLLAFIDTGFNGAIMLDEAQAARLGFQLPKDARARATLANQQEEIFLLGRGTLSWLGEPRTVTAYVLLEPPTARRVRIARTTDEEVLIGAELLIQCRLEIDFPARSVRITKVT